MPKENQNAASRRTQKPLFDKLAAGAVWASGTSGVFAIAVALLLIWAALGPVAGFSETWQLVVNTGTTIITFLMVFLIQHAQNKDSAAIHLKLNELLASHSKASNRLISIEDLDDDSLDQLRKFYGELAELAERGGGVRKTHSIEEAGALHDEKQAERQERRSSASPDAR